METLAVKKCTAPGQRARRAPNAKEHHQSCDSGLCSRQDTCIHSTAGDSLLQNPIAGHTTIGRGFIPGQSCQLLEAGGAEAGHKNFYQYADLTAHKDRMQGTTSCRANVPSPDPVLRLPRFHSNENVANLRSRKCALPVVHSAENPQLKDVSEHTHHRRPAGNQCVAFMPRTAEIKTTTSAPYVPLLTPSIRSSGKSEPSPHARDKSPLGPPTRTKRSGDEPRWRDHKIHPIRR